MRDDIFTFHLYNYIQRHVNNKNASYFYNKTISDRPTVTDIKRQIADNIKYIGEYRNRRYVTVIPKLVRVWIGVIHIHRIQSVTM